MTNATGLLLEQVDALAQDSAHGQHAHDEHEEAARRLTRALGLARQKWGNPSGEIVPALESLAHAHTEIADDAAMELGLAGVSAALTSRTETESLNHLRDALVWFQAARNIVEGRHDAELLATALHAVLTFAHGGTISAQTVVELRARVLDWVHGGLDEEPQWRGHRADALLAWFHLVDRLSHCAELGATHWWEPASLIASIGKAVIAQNAVLVATLPDTPPDDAAVPPVMERMLAPFLDVADKRTWLDRWLEQEADDDPDAAEGIGSGEMARAVGGDLDVGRRELRRRLGAGDGPQDHAVAVEGAADKDEPVNQVRAADGDQQRHGRAGSVADQMRGPADHFVQERGGVLRHQLGRDRPLDVGGVAVAAALGEEDAEPAGQRVEVAGEVPGYLR